MVFLNRWLEVMQVEPEFETTSLLAVRQSVLLSAVSLVSPLKPTVPFTSSVRHGVVEAMPTLPAEREAPVPTDVPKMRLPMFS